MSHDFPDGPDYNPEPIDDDPWDVDTTSHPKEETMSLTQSEREELSHLSYYANHARGAAALNDSERARLDELTIRERLEYLRGELRAERISWGELAELQALAPHIDPSDVELLEAAGVPEHE